MIKTKVQTLLNTGEPTVDGAFTYSFAPQVLWKGQWCCIPLAENPNIIQKFDSFDKADQAAKDFAAKMQEMINISNAAGARD